MIKGVLLLYLLNIIGTHTVKDCVLDKPRINTSDLVLHYIQDIENQKQAALVTLKNQSGQMAADIAEKLLGRELANKAEQEAFAKSLAEKINLN